MNTLPEIYDSKGGARPLDSFSQAELDSIPPELRERFNALHVAATAATAGEQRIRDAMQAVREAKADVDKKVKRLGEIKPVPTFMDLHRALVGKPVPPIPPEILARVESIEAAIEQAQEKLAMARDELVAAQRAVVPLRRAQGAAFQNYIAETPARSFKDVHHEVTTNYRAPAPVRRQYLSAVDEIAAGTKQAPRRRHPQAVPGFAFRRGGTTQRTPMASMRPKLPSEV